jgi:hypothetical protein
MAKDNAILDTCVPLYVERISEQEVIRRTRGLNTGDDKNWLRLTGEGDQSTSVLNTLEDRHLTSAPSQANMREPRRGPVF